MTEVSDDSSFKLIVNQSRCRRFAVRGRVENGGNAVILYYASRPAAILVGTVFDGEERDRENPPGYQSELAAWPQWNRAPRMDHWDYPGRTNDICRAKRNAKLRIIHPNYLEQ